MRRILLTAAAVLSALSRVAEAQSVDTDLAFMESCRAERDCVCDSVQDWFACVVDASQLAQRGTFGADALVASIVPEADRHLARECAPETRGILHRLCEATVQLREIALAMDPSQSFAEADLHGEPELDAPNDEWRAFLEGSSPEPFPSPSPTASPSPLPTPMPSPSPGHFPTSSVAVEEAEEFLAQMGGGPQQQQQGGGTRVPAGDAMRRGGSPQTAGLLPASAAARMCQAIPPSGSNPSYAQCVPPLCDCPDGPKVNVVVQGATIEFSPKMVCETVGQGLGDLLEKVAHVPGGSAAMLNILGMTAQVLDAIASNAGPILCGHARNSTYISDDCINNYSGRECQGARLALACLGCGNDGVKECSARCLCFWQALANYNQDRRRREDWGCRNLGIGCPDDVGYFYRLGISCINPPPGGLRSGGYR